MAPRGRSKLVPHRTGPGAGSARCFLFPSLWCQRLLVQRKKCRPSLCMRAGGTRSPQPCTCVRVCRPGGRGPLLLFARRVPWDSAKEMWLPVGTEMPPDNNPVSLRKKRCSILTWARVMPRVNSLSPLGCQVNLAATSLKKRKRRCPQAPHPYPSIPLFPPLPSPPLPPNTG